MTKIDTIVKHVPAHPQSGLPDRDRAADYQLSEIEVKVSNYFVQCLAWLCCLGNRHIDYHDPVDSDSSDYDQY